MKTIIVVAIILAVCAPGMLLTFARLGMQALKIDVRGGERCWNVPAKARNIYAKGSHISFAAEFEISEQDFVDYCKTRNWGLEEIAAPVSVLSYQSYGGGGQQKVTVRDGLFHDGLTKRGGFIVAFDRNAQKGFMQYSHH